MCSLLIHGRKSLELHKCHLLRGSVKLVQNMLSAFPTSFSSLSDAQDGEKEKNTRVSFLIQKLGRTKKQAERMSRKIFFPQDSVGRLLKSHGLTDSQILGMVKSYPRLLVLDARKSLAPKLKFLQSRGATSFELSEILPKCPKILGMKKMEVTSFYYDFAKDIIAADKSSKVENVAHSSLPKQENIMRNVFSLRELGVPQKLFFPLLTSDHKLVSGKRRVEETMKQFVEKSLDLPKFVEALNVIKGMSDETTEKKLNLYRSLGFAVEDVWLMFKKFPRILGISEKNILNTAKIFLGLGFTRDEFTMMVKRHPPLMGYSAESVKKKTEFLVKEMHWPLAEVRPEILSYSMEERIVPRCNVVKVLMSKGLIGSELPSVSTVFKLTNQVFLNRFVNHHDDKELVAELTAIFTARGDSVAGA